MRLVTVFAASLRVYEPLAASRLLRWAGLGALVLGGSIAYGIAGQLLGAFDIRTLARRRR